MLLAISQTYVLCNNLEKIYLINPQWVEQYNYKEINLLVNKRKNELINNWNKTYNLNSLSTVIPLLNMQQLKKMEQNINSNNNIPFEASFEQIELQDKYFVIYKEFIIVNNHLFTLLQKYFQITPSGEQIFYIHKKGEGDLLIISNYQVYNQINQVNSQNSILAGIMNRDENKFDIKHIFDYKDYNILNKEKNILLTYDFKVYLNNRLKLSPQNNNEMIIPIFNNNNQIIGTYYRYIQNYNYKIHLNYSQLLSSNQLSNFIYLYVNDISIKEKLKSMHYNDEEFYLIKKELLLDIQNKYNYLQLKKFFEGKLNCTIPNQNQIYNIIKSLPQNEKNEFINNLNQINIQKALPGSYDNI